MKPIREDRWSVQGWTWLRLRKRKQCFLALAIAGVIFLGPMFLSAATYTVNVYLPTAQLQSEFLANATSYFLGAMQKSPYFANTYTLNVTGPSSGAPTGKLPCDLDRNIALMVANSTMTYIYGYVEGVDDERDRNLKTIGSYIIRCSTPAVFGVSSGTWNPGVCGTSLLVPAQEIYTQNFSTPTPVPGFK